MSTSLDTEADLHDVDDLDVDAADLSTDLSTDLHDDVDEEEDGVDDEAAGGARSGKPSSAGSNRALIRRVAHKTYELSQVPEEKLTLVAHLLGSAVTVPDVTVAVFIAPRSAGAAAKDLFEIGEASDMEAAALAMAQGRARMKAVWTLLEHLGATDGAIPNVDFRAAITVATAVKGLKDDVLGALREAVALTKRS